MVSLLYLMVWLVAALAVVITVWTAQPSKKSRIVAFLSLSVLVYTSYQVGAFDGRGRYYASLRSELSPFLRQLGVVSEEKKKEAIKDFFLGAEEIKTTPEEYLASVKHAHDILKKEPIQLPETTRGK